MRKERKRINISLTLAEYAEAETLARAGGFKNVCAFARALLAKVAQYSARRRKTAQELARQPTTITAEIAEMFEELIDWDAASPADARAALYANEKHENQ